MTHSPAQTPTSRKPARPACLAITGCGVVVLLCPYSWLAILLALIVSYPPAEWIAQDYLKAVTQENAAAALALGSNQPRSCSEGLAASIQRDIKQLGGAELRNVQILRTGGGGGSDNGLRIVWLAFEYRQSSQPAWQAAVMTFATNTPNDGPGLRYLCGADWKSGEPEFDR